MGDIFPIILVFVGEKPKIILRLKNNIMERRKNIYYSGWEGFMKTDENTDTRKKNGMNDIYQGMQDLTRHQTYLPV